MYVIPPAAERTTVTEAMLVSSTVPEVAPAAYSGGTTYALGARASVAAAGNALDVYESLQAGNTGHTPASSPTWWKLVGQTYGVYASGTSYALEDRVIDPTTHRVYVSLVAANTGNPLTDATKWFLEGYTNRWASLDLTSSTGTTAPSPVTYVFTPGKRIDSFGFAGLIADAFTVTVRKDGVEIYTRTESLRTRVITGWVDWLTKPFDRRKAASRNDMPLRSGVEIEVTFTRGSGDVTVGAQFFNRCVELGELETEPSDDAQNFSTFTRTAEGTATDFRAGRVIPLIRVTAYANALRTPELRRTRDELKDTPAFWVGLNDSSNPYFESVLSVAVWKGFKLTPSHAALRVDLDLEEA